MNLSKKAIEIKKLFTNYGTNDYIGEDINQVEHAIQTAMRAEIDDKNNRDLILASLLHDVGHLVQFNNLDKDKSMGGYGRKSHELIGADFLKHLGFNDKIIYLVESHVLTKRYLVAADNDYMNKLSNASKVTLKYQGGPMTIKEQKEFELHKWFKDALKLRSYDDCGKNIGKKIKSLDYFLCMI